MGVVDFCDSRYKNLINLRGYERQTLGENQNGIYIPEKDIYMIGGQEVPTKEGHLLFLGTGINSHLKKGRRLT